jgi:hypothetical protein
VVRGDTLYAIVRDWNEKGYKTKTGLDWNVNGLKRVLVSGRIAGLREHGPGRTQRTVIGKAAWPAIIDEEMHGLLVSILTDPKRTTNGGSNARSYLLSGFVFCGDCGGRMIARPTGDGQRRYVCVGNRKGHQLARLAERVEEVVRDVLLDVLRMEPVRVWLDGVPQDDEEVADLVAEERKVVELLDRLNREYAEEDLWEKADFIRERTRLLARRDEVRTKISARADRRTLTSLPEGDLEDWWDTAVLEQKRDLVRALVGQVVIEPAVRGLNKFDPDKVKVFPPDELAEVADLWDLFEEAGRRAVPVLESF